MSHRRRNRVLSLAVLALGFCGAAPALAAVTPGGDTAVAATSVENTTVGNTGAGTLDIDGGSTLRNVFGYVGYEAGATGTAIVSGAGSLWANNGASVYVGYSGSGILSIENGGQITSSTGYLGFRSGAAGAATVAGPGSTWTNSDELYVGFSGEATLTVADGGLVTTRSLYASLSDLYGNGTISAKGAVLDADLVFDSTNMSLQRTLAFGSGGTLEVMYSGGDLGAGHKGSGSVRIADGVPVLSSRGCLGHRSGSTGTATVSGPGSKWTSTSYFYVGYAGTGALSIEDGGQVSSSTAYIGYASGSSGVVSVSGAGSKWTNSFELHVGLGGAGKLTVADGGSVSTKHLYASLSDLHGNGTITAKGAVLDADLVFDGTHGTAQTLTFGSGGTLNLTIDGTGILGAGYRSNGSLRIADGVTVASTGGCIGYAGGSNGTVTVRGPGSTWSNSEYLYVGYRGGSGTLSIEAGGQMSSRNSYLGVSPDSAGTVTVSGTGSAWTSNGVLCIGQSGSGTLNVESGGQISSISGVVGTNPDAMGTATVGGAGAKWTISGPLYIGQYGGGVLNIEAGGQVSSTFGYIGYGSGAAGAVTISGAGSTWINSHDLTIGSFGSGALTVADGGSVSAKTLYAAQSDLHGNGTITARGAVLDTDLVFDSTHGTAQSLAFGSGGVLNLAIDGTGALGAGYKGNGSLRIADGVTIASTGGYLGHSAGSAGTATVSGTGSTWSSSVFAGYYGSGTLNIESGGQVSGSSGYIGYRAGSSGAVTVTGAGSRWTSSGGLYVGREGSGTMTVANGGSVSAKTLYASLGNLYGDGTITANGVILDAELVFDGTRGTTQTLAFGSGGTLNLIVNGTGSLGAGYRDIGSLRIADGVVVASSGGYLGHNADSSGTATVTGAGSKWTCGSNLYAGYSRSSGTLNVESGGQVSSGGGYLAYEAGSIGTATVKGLGSKWTSTSLYAGYSGSATLGVEDGAQISSSSGSIGYNAGSAGTVTVSGPGSTWANSGTLNVGYSGDGTLSIQDGGQVSSSSGYVGYNAYSAGTVTVSGAGSTWTNSGTLYVGNSGSGTLRIDAGGQVSSSGGNVGYSIGSAGMVIVTGAGSRWTSSGSLSLGNYRDASGSLTVADGGLVTAKTLYASLDDLHGDGTITANGAVLDADLVFDSASGAVQTLNFGSGGALNLTVDGTAVLGVGYKGSGSLRIADGVTVATASGYLGYHGGSSGTATVTGAGSKWTNSGSLDIQNGTLRIEAGGQVSNSVGYLGSTSGPSSKAVVSGTGSQWTNKSSLYVGDSIGNGSLRIENAGQVSSPNGYIGQSKGSAGTASVTGAGSKWSNSATLYVGYSGSGTVGIDDGGQVTSYHGQVGYNAGSTGTATVSGAGSRWAVSYELHVGASGSGTLSVESGAQVSNRVGTIGSASGASGAAAVAGAGSKWICGSTLYVGRGGSGTLSVAEGGQVSNSDGYIGSDAGSAGTVSVTGTGSAWTSSGNLYVGASGSGRLTVADGGLVSAKTLYASMSDLSGNGTIAANGAVLDADLVFDSASGATPTVPFGSGGTLNLTIDGTAALGAGYRSSGSLRITDGVAVTSKGGYLGHGPGSNGVATVSGAGSSWSHILYGLLYIGHSGSGDLRIEEGGQVNSGYSYLGYSAGSAGTATVVGAGSTWINNGRLYVGASGSGKLTVADGGLVTARTVYASPADLHGNGTITANGAVLDADLVFDSTHGTTQTLSFGSGGILNLALNGGGALGAGHKGNGSLRIVDGMMVASDGGCLGFAAGSTGVATVSGAGSRWMGNGVGDLDVGFSGNGVLRIESGGQVDDSSGRIGAEAGSSGMVTVSGSGSKWTNQWMLHVGDAGRGALTVADGSQVITGTLSINSQSTVRLHVSGSDMLLVGRAPKSPLSLTNNGTVALYADPFLPAGVHRPISNYANWLGSGSYKAFGGTWSSSSKTFTVTQPTALVAGASDALAAGERLLFTDLATGRRVGASFGGIAGIVSFSATPMGTGDLASLAGLLEEGEGVLSAWDFTTNYGGEAMLSFDVGPDREGLAVWHLEDGVWSSFTPSLFTYDANGIASFTVSSFSGYAVTAAVPEPGMMGLAVVAGLMLGRRRARG